MSKSRDTRRVFCRNNTISYEMAKDMKEIMEVTLTIIEPYTDDNFEQFVVCFSELCKTRNYTARQIGTFVQVVYNWHRIADNGTFIFQMPSTIACCRDFTMRRDRWESRINRTIYDDGMYYVSISDDGIYGISSGTTSQYQPKGSVYDTYSYTYRDVIRQFIKIVNPLKKSFILYRDINDNEQVILRRGLHLKSSQPQYYNEIVEFPTYQQMKDYLGCSFEYSIPFYW